MNLLALIPARAGSVGVPNKNTRPLVGQSLVERAVGVARASEVPMRILVSTDSEEARDQARLAGAEVPFMRPAELSESTTPMIAVVEHALHHVVKEGWMPDAILLLQPTSPLRTPDHIRRAIQLLPGNDSVCSVIRIPATHSPHYVMRLTESGHIDYFLPEGKFIKRRQDVPPAYTREGTIFLTRREVFEQARDFYGERCAPLLIDPRESLSIDTMEDWEEAERRLTKW